MHPTLGSPVRSLDEVYDILGDLPFSAEYKYDGQRAQIHASNDGSEARVKIFSRHLEDMTTKVTLLVHIGYSNLTNTGIVSRRHIACGRYLC